MWASKSITIGLVSCALGAGLILSESYTHFNPALGRPIAFILLALGMLAFLVGLAGLAALLKPPKGMHRDDAGAAALALIRAMIAISIADDRLDDNEIRNISKIYSQLTNSHIDDQTIRETADAMLADGTQISDEMNRLRNTLDESMKLKIIKASLFILAADGKVETDEEAMLDEIRQGLKISAGKVKQVKETFLKSKGLRT